MGVERGTCYHGKHFVRFILQMGFPVVAFVLLCSVQKKNQESGEKASITLFIFCKRKNKTNQKQTNKNCWFPGMRSYESTALDWLVSW